MSKTLELSSFTQLKELIDSGLLVDVEKKDDSIIKDDTENLYNVVNLRTKTGANLIVALKSVDLLAVCEYLYPNLDIFELARLSNFVLATISYRTSNNIMYIQDIIHYEVCLENPSRIIKGTTETLGGLPNTIQSLCNNGLNKCEYEGDLEDNKHVTIERVSK